MPKYFRTSLQMNTKLIISIFSIQEGGGCIAFNEQQINFSTIQHNTKTVNRDATASPVSASSPKWATTNKINKTNKTTQQLSKPRAEATSGPAGTSRQCRMSDSEKKLQKRQRPPTATPIMVHHVLDTL